MEPLSPNKIRCFSGGCVKLRHYKVNVPKEFGTTFNLEVNQYGREKLKYGERLFSGFPDIVESNGPEEFTTTGEIPDIKYQDLRPVNSFGRKFGCLNYIFKMNCIKDCKPGGANANALGYLGKYQISFYICNTENFIYEYRNKNNWILDGDNDLVLYNTYYLEDITTLKELSNLHNVYSGNVIFSDDSFSLTDWENPKQIGFERISIDEAQSKPGYFEMPEELVASACKKFKNISVFIMSWGNLIVDESLGIINNECLGERSQYNFGSKKISDVIKESMQQFIDEIDINLEINIICPHESVSQGRSVISRFVDEPYNIYNSPNHQQSYLGEFNDLSVDFNDLTYEQIQYIFYPTLPPLVNPRFQYYEILEDIWAINTYELSKGPMSISSFDSLPFCTSKYIEPTYLTYSIGAETNDFSITFDEFISTVYPSSDVGLLYRGAEVNTLYQQYSRLLATKTAFDFYTRKCYDPIDIANYVLEKTDESTDLCIIFNDGITPIGYSGYLKDYEPPIYNYDEGIRVDENTFLEKRYETNWMNKFIDAIRNSRSFEITFGDFDDLDGIDTNLSNNPSINPDIDYDENYTTRKLTPYLVRHGWETYDAWPEHYTYLHDSNRITDLKIDAVKYEVGALVGKPGEFPSAKFIYDNTGMHDNLVLTRYFLAFPSQSAFGQYSLNSCSHDAFGLSGFNNPPYTYYQFDCDAGFFGNGDVDIECSLPPVYILSFKYAGVANYGTIIVEPTVGCGESINSKYLSGDIPVIKGCGYEDEYRLEEWWGFTYSNYIGFYVSNEGYYSNNTAFTSYNLLDLTDIVTGTHPHINPRLSFDYSPNWYTNIVDNIFKFINNPIISSVKIEPIFYDEDENQIYSKKCNDRPISDMYIIEPDDGFDYDENIANKYMVIEVDGFPNYYNGLFYYYNVDPKDYFREFEIQITFAPGENRLDRVILKNYYGVEFEYLSLDIADYSTKEYINSLEENDFNFDINPQVFIGENTIQERFFTISYSSLQQYKNIDICNMPRQIKVTIE